MAKFKKAECKVFNYNKLTHTADIDFKGHGIRVFGVSEEDVKDDTLTLMYCGKIGTPDFKYKLPNAEAEESEAPVAEAEIPTESCADIVTNE